MATQYPEKTLPPITIDLSDPTPPPANLVQVPAQPGPVNVTLSGPADLVSTIQATNIKPYLDLSVYKSPGPHEVPVKLKDGYLPPDVHAEISPKTITVYLETLSSKVLKVDVVTQGDVNPNYSLSSAPEANPAEVTIQGRETQVNQVAKAQVKLDVQNRSGPLQTTLQIKLLDNQGQEITEDTLNNLKINPTTVSVSANIESKIATRTVPVRVTTEGSPATGYIAGAARINPPLVTLSSGDSNVLDKVEYVETEPIKIEGATSEVSATVTLVTPRNTTIIQSSDKVQVRVGIVPFQAKKTITLPIKFLNQSNSYRYDYGSTTVNVEVSGSYQAFETDLPLDRFKATVDMNERGPGTYVLPVSVETPPEFTLTSNPTVKVTVVRPAPTSAPPTPTTAPTPTVAPTTTPATTPSVGSSPLPSPAREIAPTGSPRPTTPPLTPGLASAPGQGQTPAPPVPTTSGAIGSPENLPPASTRSVNPRGTPTPRRPIAPPITPSQQPILASTDEWLAEAGWLIEVIFAD